MIREDTNHYISYAAVDSDNNIFFRNRSKRLTMRFAKDNVRITAVKKIVTIIDEEIIWDKKETKNGK